MGIRIRKSPSRFPNFLGRRTNFPPHLQLSDTSPGNHDPYCNISTLPRQKHPPNPGKITNNQPSPPNPEGDSVTRGRFHKSPPAVLLNPSTIPPSRDKTTLPIPAKCPNTGHNSHLGRAQLHREGGNVTQETRPVREAEVRKRSAGGKFRPSRGGGHKSIGKRRHVFRISWAGGQIFPRTPEYRTRGTTSSNLQVRGRFLPRAPKSGKCSRIFTLPRQNHPPNTGKLPPISTTIPISGGRNCTGREKMSRDLGGADF